MKKFINYLFIALFIPALFLTSCKDDKNDDPVVVGTYADLQSYMTTNSMDLPDLLANNWVTDAKYIADGGFVEADGTIPTYHVFDIRAAADFAKGHVKGAINVLLADVLTKAAEVGKDKPILVFCYTGQTAGRAVMALRLSGYNARVAKFGFSAWTNNPAFDSWSGKVGNIAVGSPNWNTNATATLPVKLNPTWTSTSTDGATILAERVQVMLTTAGWSATAAEVLAAPVDYTIYNYWGEADYLKYGHFSGAYQYTTISFATTNALDPDNSNLVYCYTGQTSSITTAWFNVLGYNVKSVSFGVNALMHDALTADSKNNWHFPYHSFPFEGTLAK